MVSVDSHPYLAFYVEGRGYFWYAKMPFEITGVLSEFAHMTAIRLHMLTMNNILELFVDDGGTAADTFEEMMEKLRMTFTQIRKTGLSLSPSKTKLFMTEALFAGATVRPDGV